MKPSTIVGVLLILAGIVGFAVGGFSFKHEKKDIDMGPIVVEHQQTKHIVIPPAFSGILLVSGIAVLALGARRG